MTEFNNNNKFVPQAPKTFQVLELKDQQQEQQPVKKSSLSFAARSKVINRSGSGYLSENQGGYGPCFASFSNDCNCGFKISATLVDMNGNSRNQTKTPKSYWEAEDMARDVTSGWGEWEDGGSDFYGTNRFRPSRTARIALSVEIENAAYRHGPQNITVAENSFLEGLIVTINGIRK